MKRLSFLLFILSIVSCTRTYNIFSDKYPVSFSCDISLSPFNSTNTLGYFLSIYSKSTKDGYKVKAPNGNVQEFPYTEIQNRVFSFGLAGIIIGRPYFGEGEIYAYDLGCPQCDRSSAKLNINMEGIATCSRCDNRYDLNNNGIAQSGDSRPLYRYQTTLNNKILLIHN